VTDWTYDPASGRNVSDWINASMVPYSHALGIDPYDPWGLNKTAKRQTLSRQMGLVLPYNRALAPSLPTVIGEVGTSPDPNNAAYQATWMQAGFDFVAAQPDVPVMAWFDYAPTVDTDTTFDAQGLSQWASINQSPKTIRLAQAGL
jgi:hypothetical protein